MKKNFVFWGGFLILSIVFLFSINNTHASSISVAINELMWSGSEASSSDEWIELRNLSNNDIDLSGWKIKYGNDNEMVSIASGTIPANGYFLIANSNESHQYAQGESILNITPDYIDSGIALSNENLQLKLVNANEQLIDIAGNGDKPLAGNNTQKYSMERNNPITDGILPSSWHTATYGTNLDLGSQSKATPKHENSPPLFQSITNYPRDLNEYISIDDCLEAEGNVTYVVDGDTLDVDLNGDITRVRLLGIDSPESSKSSDFGVNEPYYKESKDYITNLLLNQTVKIVVSANPNEQYDNYQRLLAVVIFNEQNINAQSVKNGFSKTYYLDNQILIKDLWLENEKIAQGNHFGIWEYFGLKGVVYINELMPNPSGEDSENEWIELYNSSKQEINLANWFLDDAEHGSNPYLIPPNTKISPGGYLLINIADSQIALNNSGDSVRLFTPDLNLSNEINYTNSAKENISYMRGKNNDFQWTKTPTPGYINNYSDPDRPDYVKIDKISNLDTQKPGDPVEIEGYANSSPHQLSNQYFYMEDDTAGVQIYNYDGHFPIVSIGQKVMVFGEISDSKILRVKVDNINDIIILNQIVVVEPSKLTPREINKSYIGKLVRVKGAISKLSGQTFYIKDESSELKVQIRGPTNFSRPQMSRGDIVEITGILYISSQGNISLLPRFKSDIKIIQKVENFSKNNPTIIERIIDLNNQFEGDNLVVKGIVNSIPGMLGERYFYIEDNTGGVEIYSYNKYFPNLSIGDYVEISGILSASKKRIKTYSVSDFNIINSNNKIDPIKIDKDTDLSMFYGMLAIVKGVIVSKKNQKITISVDGNKFIVYLKDITNIKPSILKIGDSVEIMGIIDEYQGQYRINPRFAKDIFYVRKETYQKSQVKGVTMIKSFFKKIYLPKMDKYLAKKPENKYNLEAFKDGVKTIVFMLQLMLFLLIIEWLCKGQSQQKIF